MLRLSSIRPWTQYSQYRLIQARRVPRSQARTRIPFRNFWEMGCKRQRCRVLERYVKGGTHWSCFEKSSAASSSSQLSSQRCSLPPFAVDPVVCSASSWGQSEGWLAWVAWGCGSVCTYLQWGSLRTRRLPPALGVWIEVALLALWFGLSSTLWDMDGLLLGEELTVKSEVHLRRF